MAFNLYILLSDLIFTIVANVVIISPVLWIAGRLLAGKQNAKFTDAIWTVIIGTLAFYFAGYLLQDLLGSIILSYLVLFVIWLALVKHFFDCGWLKALAISILAVIIAIIIWVLIGMILALIGIGTGWFPNGSQYTNV
jgi:hypothetical protein